MRQKSGPSKLPAESVVKDGYFAAVETSFWGCQLG